jgi:hypothetical protein
MKPKRKPLYLSKYRVLRSKLFHDIYDSAKQTLKERLDDFVSIIYARTRERMTYRFFCRNVWILIIQKLCLLVGY